MVLDFLDAIFTLIWVRAGLAQETNPLLHRLVNEHRVWSTVAKLALTLVGSLLLWRTRHRPLALIGILVTFVVYHAVLIHHLRSSSELILQLTGLH